MRGDEQPALRRDGADLLLGPRVQLVEPRVVGVGVGAIGVGPAGVERGEPGGDVADDALHAEGVEPEVGIVEVVAVAFVLLVPLLGFGLRELDGIDDLPQLDDGAGVPGRVLQQFAQPRLLQAQADAEHEIGVGDLGDVPGAGLEPVWVGADGDDAEDLDVVAAHVLDPVRDDVGRDDDADGLGGFGLRLGLGSGRRRLLGRRRRGGSLLVVRAGDQGCEQREGEKQDGRTACGPHYDTVSHFSLSFPGQGGSPEPSDHFLVLSLDTRRGVAGERIIVCQLPSAVMQRSQVT